MKSRLLLVALAGVAVAVLAAALQAAPPQGRGPAWRGRGPAAAEQEGQATSERVADRAGRRFARQEDCPDDGPIRQQRRQRLLEGCPLLAEKLDTDGDGQVSEQEWAAAREQFRAKMEQRRERKGDKGEAKGPRGPVGEGLRRRSGELREDCPRGGPGGGFGPGRRGGRASE